MKTIDLRSDTVTRPGVEMRAAMAAAEVGDDVYGEDPTVNALEALAAERLGKAAALFVCSGTQSNLCALLAHCGRGDEYLVGQGAHTFRYEGGGAAVLGGIQPQPIDFQPDGTIDLEAAAGQIKPDDPHFARTRLLCLENTQAGKVLPPAYLLQAGEFARRHGLGLHLDGARLFNAAVALGVPAADLAAPFDTVSICLSKGLGAPAGSVLCGGAEMVAAARRWRKVLGGGMRQAGVLAAAGIFALENNVDRLAEDHANARALADGLAAIAGLVVDPGGARTNMVFLDTGERDRREDLCRFLAGEGVRVDTLGKIRLVTHLDVEAEDIERAVGVFAAFFDRGGRAGAGDRQRTDVAAEVEPA